MSSSNGTNYFQKSMNGIITLDDGAGTVIEDGIITADTININDLTTNTISTYDLTVNHDLTVNNNIDTLDLTVNHDLNVINNIDTFDLTVNHDLNVTNNIHSGYLTVDNTISSEFISLIDQFGAFYGSTLESLIPDGDVKIYDNTTNSTLSFATNSGILTIGQNCDNIYIGKFSNVNVGGNTNLVTIGEQCNVDISTANTAGTINIGSSGTINIGSSGAVSVGRFTFSSYTIQPKNTNQDISFCTNSTSGTTISVGNLGTVKLGNIIKIKGVEIFGGAINDTMSLFPTQTGGQVLIGAGLTTGSVNICDSLTSTGTVSIGNLGTTTIGRLKIIGQNINPVVNGTETNCFTTCTGDTKFGGTGSIFIGQPKTIGFIAMGGGCQTIMNGELVCHQTLTLDNSTQALINATSGTGNLLIQSSNTMNCQGSGNSKFGSYNGGQVDIGTQSYSDVVIGSNGSGANAKTTRIGGRIIVTGQGGSDATLYGGTKYNSTASNFTIPTPLNINNYLFIAIGTLAGQTVTLPSYIDGQILYIRNNKTGTNLVVAARSGETIFLKNGSFASTFSIPALNYIQIMGVPGAWYIL